MEDARAEFVTMVMDRLHALERENDSLKADIAEMKIELTQHQQALHLCRRFTAFSDGYGLSLGLTKEPDGMWPSTNVYLAETKLDELHLRATATYGPMQIHPHEDCWDDTILVGEAGNIDARISVEQLINAVNDWCSALTPDGQTRIDQYMQCSLGCPAWDGLLSLGFDDETKRFAYQMAIVYS